jgi:hypothetical protein
MKQAEQAADFLGRFGEMILETAQAAGVNRE